MGRPIPTFLKFSQNTGAAPPNTDNYYIMPEHSFVTMKTAVGNLPISRGHLPCLSRSGLTVRRASLGVV